MDRKSWYTSSGKRFPYDGNAKISELDGFREVHGMEAQIFFRAAVSCLTSTSVKPFT